MKLRNLVLSIVCVAAMASATQAAPYSIARGDLLNIIVYRQEDMTLRVRVDSQGFIRMPVAGRILVAGKDPSEIEKTLIGLLGNRGFNHPEVVVSVEQFAPRTVFVLGAVKGAASMLIPEGGEMSAMQAISVAGGLAEDANVDGIVVQRRHGLSVSTVPVSAREILNGQTANDVMLEPSDTIVVPHVKAISVLGTVKKPGQFYAKPDSALTVSRIIALAGGVERPNSLSKIRVMRGDKHFEVDVQSLLETGQGGADMTLHPGDIVYVPETRW